jgi:hypothetical protein
MTMERGITLYYYDINKQQKGAIVSNNAMVNTADTSTLYKYLPIVDINELNPTASDVFVTGSSTIFVYENYDSEFSITFSSRIERMQFVNEILPYIYEIGVINDIYSADHTEFLKKVIVKHIDFTENNYENGIVSTVTLEMRGTWYWVDSIPATGSLMKKLNQTTVLTIPDKDMYDPATDTDYVPYHAKFSDGTNTLSVDRKQDINPQSSDGTGLFLSSDGQAYDRTYNDSLDTHGYKGIGPGRNADWTWQVNTDASTIKDRGIQALPDMLSKNVPVSYAISNFRKQDVTSRMTETTIHYVDFI